MQKINELGKVYKSDLLVIGGSIAGLATAIKAKQLKPDMDILVVEKGYAGFSGQSTRAGHGIALNDAGGTPTLTTAEYLVGSHTPYMSDQELLLKYIPRKTESAQFLLDCGVSVGKNPDGTLWNAQMPHRLWGMGGIDITVNESLRKHALKLDIRILSRVNIFELLTAKEDGRAIGGIGFDMAHGECNIFRAKAVCLCTHGAHFKKAAGCAGMFMAYGTGLGAAYRAGAMMRNAEFSTQSDNIQVKDGLPSYGAYNLLHNGKGDNISAKYQPGGGKIDGVSAELAIGMRTEVENGNPPIWADLEHPDMLYKIVSAREPEANARVLPNKFEWEELVDEKTAKYRGALGLQPEMTLHFAIQVEALHVDHKFRTCVPGLFASGKMTAAGCSYFGWTHGDGVGNAAVTSLFAGESIAEYFSEDPGMPDLQYDQVRRHKEKIYAPLHRDTAHSHYEIWNRIEELSHDIYIALNKSEKVIHAVLNEIEELKKIVPLLSADDPHSLAKCLEAADSLLAFEMVFRAADMRKESRGIQYPHYRSDYPAQDDKNWLKWINIKQGTSGEMELFTEDIPMWRYPFRPEGYEIPEGHAEEYYVDRARC
ncbi:MAG: FAD-binding protein [Clostridiales Family XIII bacterium]|jgi:succinate dehydrogenase/fumarate reductase flavoprotein subunit|nr:FAD-binding protein [Clostridiales Family XIII bacterium]